MSENILKLKSIKPNSVINIEVGTGFYQRIRQLFSKLIEDNPNENLIKALENIKSKESSTPYEYHLETLLSLIYEMEAKAEAQELIDIKDVDKSKI